ncbi:alpha/beta fold hydrolase [Lentzea sp. NPDC059081]|uniref:alpha/beta fold hydrolase n=1 Tax=Lentzea sp. NPDC059081 TaxID=3346719 RepID=UPI0036BF8121
MTKHSIPLRRKAIALGAAVLVALAAFPASAATGSPSATTRTVTNAEHDLVFHVVDGRSPALVLDAGGGLSSSYWKDLAPRLARTTGRKVITYDRAGEGRSDEISGPWRIESAVSDLEAGLRALSETRKVVLVSHSIAGEVATTFAAKNPGRVAGAVLVDANVPDFFSDEMLTAFAPVVEQQRADLLAQPSTKKNRQLLAVMADFAPTHRAYNKLAWPNTVPVTVIVTSGTPFDAPEAARLWRDAQARFAQAGPNRKHVVAENTTHEGIVTERPDVVAGAVEDVLKAVR